MVITPTAQFYAIKHREACDRLALMQATFDEVLGTLWRATREVILDWWDEPQVMQMIDDGCPNTNE